MAKNKAPVYCDVEISDLKPYRNNARTHSNEQVIQLVKSIKEFGFTNPLLITPDKEIIAGHGRLAAAQELAFTKLPCVVIDGLTEAQQKALVIADNQLALNAGWDENLLRDELEDLIDLDFNIDLLGFDGDFVDELLADEVIGDTDEDDIPGEPKKPVTKRGDLWLLDNHRLICGDSTNAEHIDQLINNPVDCIITDPPYCSGGFQEAGKSAGSIGTRQQEEIANDKLSTRGYISLMGKVFDCVQCPTVYAFTDWRMWIHLYDVAESKGFSVRSMIVWNKEQMGMGRGWRSQHELILLGSKNAIPFKPKNSNGNVINCKRQKNELHPTQKPVDLIQTIIKTTDFINTVYDPFSGSGTTLIACEKEHKTFFGCELTPGFIDVIIERWQKFTGKNAVLERTGKTFNELKGGSDATNKD